MGNTINFNTAGTVSTQTLNRSKPAAKTEKSEFNISEGAKPVAAPNMGNTAAVKISSDIALQLSQNVGGVFQSEGMEGGVALADSTIQAAIAGRGLSRVISNIGSEGISLPNRTPERTGVVIGADVPATTRSGPNAKTLDWARDLSQQVGGALAGLKNMSIANNNPNALAALLR